MQNRFCCPQCGNEELQVTTETSTQTTGKNYSAGQGCLGYLLFGPLGLLCGACGEGKQTTTTNTTYWVCPKCGKKFRNPDELRNELESKKKTPTIMLIAGVIFAIIMFIALSGADAGVAFMLALFSFAIFGLFAGVSYLGLKKAEEEIDELEAEMRRFKK